jgi:hypothetical protein
MITTVHASHVMMCAMFIVLMGVNHNMTLGIIMLAYCHLVEILWIAIMSVTMLCSHGILSHYSALISINVIMLAVLRLMELSWLMELMLGYPSMAMIVSSSLMFFGLVSCMIMCNLVLFMFLTTCSSHGILSHPRILHARGGWDNGDGINHNGGWLSWLLSLFGMRLAVLTNHVFAYPVSSNVSYMWAVGLTLTLILILRLLTGIILVTEPMVGVLHILVHMILSNVGRIAPGLHAIGSTMVMAVLLLHMLR